MVKIRVPGRRDTSKATAAAARKAAESRADWLRERGWVCISPEAVARDRLLRGRS